MIIITRMITVTRLVIESRMKSTLWMTPTVPCNLPRNRSLSCPANAKHGILSIPLTSTPSISRHPEALGRILLSLSLSLSMSVLVSASVYSMEGSLIIVLLLLILMLAMFRLKVRLVFNQRFNNLEQI